MPKVPDDISELLGSLSSGGVVANTTTGMTLREHVWIECLKAIIIANPKQNSLDAENPDQRQIAIRQNIMLACTYATWWFNAKYYFDNCINPGLAINGNAEDLAGMQDTYPGYPINNTIPEEDMGIMTPFFEWGYIDCVDKFAVTVYLDDSAGYGCGWDFCEIELAYREFPWGWGSGVVYNKTDIYQPNQSVYMPTWTNLGDAASGYDDPNMGTGPFTAYPSELDRDNDTNGIIMCPNLSGMSTEDGTSWRLYPWFYNAAGCETWNGGAYLGSFGGIDPLSLMQVRVRVKCDCDGAFGAWTTYSMISPPTPAAATSSARLPDPEGEPEAASFPDAKCIDGMDSTSKYLSSTSNMPTLFTSASQQDWTIVIRLYHNATGNKGIFDFDFLGTNNYIFLQNFGETLWWLFYYGDAGGEHQPIYTDNIADENATITITKTGSTNEDIKIYANGGGPKESPQNPTNTIPVITYDMSECRIGIRDTTFSFGGAKFNDFAIFDVAFTEAEATEAYNSGTTMDLRTHSQAANLKHYWWMGDGDDGAGNDDDGNTIYDMVGDCDMTMTGMDASDIVDW